MGEDDNERSNIVIELARLGPKTIGPTPIEDLL